MSDRSFTDIPGSSVARRYNGDTFLTNRLVGDTNENAIDLPELFGTSDDIPLFAFLSGLAIDHQFISQNLPQTCVTVMATQDDTKVKSFRSDDHTLLLYCTLGDGCLHSKLLVIQYENRLRVGVTSMNLSQLDIEEIRQNLWIADLPFILPPPPMGQGREFDEVESQIIQQAVLDQQAALQPGSPGGIMRAALASHIAAIFLQCKAAGTAECVHIQQLLRAADWSSVIALPVWNTPTLGPRKKPVTPNSRGYGLTDGNIETSPRRQKRDVYFSGVSGLRTLHNALGGWKEQTARIHMAVSSLSGKISDPRWAKSWLGSAMAHDAAAGLVQPGFPITIAFPTVPFIRETNARLANYCCHNEDKPAPLPGTFFCDPEPCRIGLIRAVSHAKVFTGVSVLAEPLWQVAGSANLSVWAWGFSEKSPGASFEFGVFLPVGQSAPIFDVNAPDVSPLAVATNSDLGLLAREEREGITLSDMRLPEPECPVV